MSRHNDRSIAIAGIPRATYVRFMDLEPGGIYRTLIERAIEVRQRAYAPYSGIHVGSAVESTAGNITVGCNIECVTLSETSHAEQNAIVAMVTVGEHRIRRIAVAVAPRDIVFQMNGRRPRRRLSVRDVPPSCGHCLQIIWEFSGDNPLVELVFATPDGGVYRTTMGAVLPLPFKIDLPGGTKV